MTNDTVPSFSGCQLVDATRCSIIVSWDLNIKVTFIIVDNGNTLPTENDLEDIIEPMALIGRTHDQETSVVAHYFQFSCISSDKCNDEMHLKRILESLIIEDKFAQELAPILQIVSPFDPHLAACYEFNNSTDECPPTDLSNCERCQTFANKWSSPSVEFCSTCPHYSSNMNLAVRSTTFILNNRTQLADHAQLDCQLKACNSIDNVNRIYKASKITFNFDEFFKNLSDVTI